MISHVLAALMLTVPTTDSARIVGTKIVIEPLGVRIEIPAAWFDSAPKPPPTANCGHELRGNVNRRFATTRASLDSLLHATGEWDKEYSAVVDSILPFASLVGQFGPEPFGGGSCFGDLQLRIYVGAIAPASVGEAVLRRGLPTARAFFPTTTSSELLSAWQIDRLAWAAWYGDYGAGARVEIYTTLIRGKPVSLVFMHSSLGGFSAEDKQFILDHVER